MEIFTNMTFWIIIVTIVVLLAIIGYIAEGTILANKKINREKTEKQEEKEALSAWTADTPVNDEKQETIYNTADQSWLEMPRMEEPKPVTTANSNEISSSITETKSPSFEKNLSSADEIASNLEKEIETPTGAEANIVGTPNGIMVSEAKTVPEPKSAESKEQKIQETKKPAVAVLTKTENPESINSYQLTNQQPTSKSAGEVSEPTSKLLSTENDKKTEQLDVWTN